MKSIALLCAIVLGLATPATWAADDNTSQPESRSYSKIALWAPGYSPKDQVKIEGKSIKTFTKKGIEAVAMSSMVTNVGQHTDAELLQIMRDNGIQALFTLVTRGAQQDMGASSLTPGIAQSILTNQVAANSGGGAGAASPAGAHGSVGMRKAGKKAIKDRVLSPAT